MHDVTAALRASEQIPGWLMPEEAQRLYNLGFTAEADVLEIGTYHGKSTYLIARGLRDGSRPSRLITVDIHIGADGVILTPDPPAFLGQTLRTHQLDDLVVQVIGWSQIAVATLDFNTIGAVFIDGGHEFDCVRRDIESVRPRLARDTLLLFHDYHPSFPGVQRAVDDLVRRDPGFSFVELVHSLFICRMRPLRRQPTDLESELLRQLSEVSAERAQWQALAQALQASTSWRITEPLRRLMDWLRNRGG